MLMYRHCLHSQRIERGSSSCSISFNTFVALSRIASSALLHKASERSFTLARIYVQMSIINDFENLVCSSRNGVDQRLLGILTRDGSVEAGSMSLRRTTSTGFMRQ